MKPIPCLKGYTYTIIGSMFLFFGVLVLLVPKKAKNGTKCFRSLIVKVAVYNAEC